MNAIQSFGSWATELLHTITDAAGFHDHRLGHIGKSTGLELRECPESQGPARRLDSIIQ
ncbi:MAG TPA: hypothetical protein VE954_27230 [Oligoflexus sp.]|uniref:hypothetical protein n=1 Tax=Oligoflexus sp. TaxID=1971216 RepID=UPI002D4A2EDA|nr:hypothetical protein [Oligoflexus sp.]HYX36818.1 hypothetical protein [Oligoflexus sp.]